MAFNLKDGVAILGGFVGTETTQDQRDPFNNLTFLSGEINTGSTSDNSYHVVTASGSIAHPNTGTLGHVGNLDGFVVTSGNATGTGGGEESMPQSISDCMELADECGEPFDSNWLSVFEKCKQGLCEANLINFD